MFHRSSNISGPFCWSRRCTPQSGASANLADVTGMVACSFCSTGSYMRVTTNSMYSTPS